jgi:exosortase/archaeosortase family protein
MYYKLAKKFNVSILFTKRLIRFFLAFFIAWIGSIFLNDIPLITDSIKSASIDNVLTNFYLQIIDFLFSSLGYDTQLYKRTFRIEGAEGILLTYGCLGLRQISQFILFSISYYGKTVFKIIFIPTGITILITINILRMSIIELFDFYQWTSFSFIHDFSSTTLFGITILILWFYQVNNQLPVENKSTPKN